MKNPKLFEFIKKTNPDLKEILDVKVKDCDDEDGFIGEHYVVRCILAVPDARIPMYNKLGVRTQTALVRISEYRTWLDNENAIKWVD